MLKKSISLIAITCAICIQTLAIPLNFALAASDPQEESEANNPCPPGNQKIECQLDPVTIPAPKDPKEENTNTYSLWDVIQTELILAQMEAGWFSFGQDKPNDSPGQESKAELHKKTQDKLKKAIEDRIKNPDIIKRILAVTPSNQQSSVNNYLKKVLSVDHTVLCETYDPRPVDGKNDFMTERFFEESDSDLYGVIKKAITPKGLQTQIKIGVLILETLDGSVFALAGLNNIFTDANIRTAWDARVQLKQGDGSNSCDI